MKALHRLALLLAACLPAAAYAAPPAAYYDVNGQGADPTGVADSTASVLAAVTAACATTPPTPVFFPPGNYLFNRNVQVPCDGLRIYGAGPVSRLVAGVNAAQNGLFFYLLNRTNVSIDHLGFDGSASTVGGDGAFILTQGATGTQITDNYFTNNRYLIVSASTSSGTNLSHNRWHNVSTWQQTLPTWTIGTAYTTGQLVVSNAGAALYTQTAASCTSVALGLGPVGTGTGIADNTCLWNYVRLQYLETNSFGGGSNNSFDDNFFDCCIGGDPIDMGDQTNLHVVGNRVVGNNQGYVHGTSGAGSGLYVIATTSAGSVGTVIADNYIYGLTGNGLDLGCISRATVTGNIVINSGGAGSALYALSSVPCTNKQVAYTGNVFMNSYQGVAGQVALTTNAITAAGNNVLHFAATTGVVDGYFMFDNQNGATVPVGARVVSHTGTTVTLSVNAIGSGVGGAQALLFLNRYPRPPAPNSGISLGCVGTPGSCPAQDSIVIANNILSDDQTAHTQLFGVGTTGITTANLRISEDNAFVGNTSAALSAGAVFVDGGTGSNSWNCAPAQSTGNAANGAFGSMACGFASVVTATGATARAMGTNLSAAGAYSDLAGYAVQDFGRLGWQGYGSGDFSVTGDAQIGRSVLRGTGNTTAAIRLTTNNATPATNNCYNIGANRAVPITITVAAIDNTAHTNSETWLNWGGLLTRPGGSTAVTMQATPTPITTGTVTGSAISVTADTVNNCLNISFTPPTGNTNTWNVAAEIKSTEVQ
jgi:hypothetical protein